MIVLVPLPLFIIIPGTGEPGIMIICGPPGLPVTSPDPRGVVTLGGATTGEGDGVWTGAWNPGAPPAGGTCAMAGPASAARTVAATSRNLIISLSPETGPRGKMVGHQDKKGGRTLYRQDRVPLCGNPLAGRGQATTSASPFTV
jgi:hypothetical protein